MQSFTISVSGERLTTHLRVQSFKGMLEKEISWFDEEKNTTGSLSAMLSLDAKNVKAVSHSLQDVPYLHDNSICFPMQGTGIQLGVIILAATSIVVALAVCFSGSWELTLIFFLAIPLIIISHRLEFAMYSGVQSADEITSASHVVMETVGNIKTVVSLGAEDYFVNVTRENLNVRLRYCKPRNVGVHYI